MQYCKSPHVGAAPPCIFYATPKLRAIVNVLLIKYKPLQIHALFAMSDFFLVGFCIGHL